VRARAWHNDGRSMGEVRKRTRWIRPNILRLDQVGAEDTYVLYFDGTSGWEILPDKPLANLDAGDLKFAHNYVIGIVLNLWLADRDPNRVITSSGPKVIVVSTTGDSSQKTEITLDPATSLPMKETDISLSDPNHPDQGQPGLSLFFIGFAGLSLGAITPDPVSVEIMREAVVVEYPGWKRAIPFDAISSIALKDVHNRSNVWAAVVLERRQGKPIRLFRFREGSVALHDTLQSAWQSVGGDQESACPK
jgi:hypothetical protein